MNISPMKNDADAKKTLPLKCNEHGIEWWVKELKKN